MPKKTSKTGDDDLRPEYDFTKLRGKTRGKYARQFAAGTNLVPLDPDVAAAFPDGAAVNAALRLALQMAQIPRR